MAPHRLAASQFMPRPLTEVFAFFSDPDNLARITPPSMRFELMTTDRQMRSGLAIDYRIRPLLGFPVRWRTTCELAANRQPVDRVAERAERERVRDVVLDEGPAIDLEEAMDVLPAPVRPALLDVPEAARRVVVGDSGSSAIARRSSHRPSPSPMRRQPG